MANGKRENTYRVKPAEQPVIEQKLIEEFKTSEVEEKNKGKDKEKKAKSKEQKTKQDKTKKEKKPSDGKKRIIIGSLVLCLAVFLCVAFGSFLHSFFSGNHQEYGSQVFNQEITLDNTTGAIGAWIAQTLIKESFGLGAFFFVYLLLTIGFKLVINTRFRMWNIWKYALLGLVWTPLFFAFIPAPKCAIFGGAIGKWTCEILTTYVGRVGTTLVLVFTFLIYAVYEFNITFAYFRRLKEEREAKRIEAETAKAAMQQNPQNNNIPQDNTLDNNNATADDNTNKTDKSIDDIPSIDSEEEDLPPITSFIKEKEEEPTNSMHGHKENSFKPTYVEMEVEPKTDEGNTNDDKSADEERAIVDETTPERILSVDPIKPAETESAEDVELVIESVKEEKTVETPKNFEHHTIDTPFDPRFELRDYKFPTMDLLKEYGNKKNEINSEELEANKNKIVETLGNYSIAIDKIKATVGPTVTLYEIVPAAGVRISKIKNLEDDIALSLAALGIRIIAPIPGKGTIGIEVPNSKAETVSMRSVLSSEKFQNSKYALPCAIGKTIANETYVFDLAKMPHILMAGATGQGKSVGLNAIVASLLYSKHPSELKFVMVDPKKVELTLFNRIERHYLAKLPDSEDAIITDTKKVVRTLNSLCIEMDQRYDLLKQAECRNIIEYNEKFKERRLLPTEGHRFLPYIVLIVDEFADLIMTAGREVEAPIARLAQLARAIGIHLIIATQRPSVNVITGSIKANFPARIAFRVISAIDSKTILDTSGANQLIGRGDMLISTGNDIVRLQCAFIDTPEVEAVTEYIGAQRGYPEPFMLPEVPEDEGDGMTASEDDGERDSLFEEAAYIVVQTQQGSTSMIQRKLKLGYNRAGRIIDQLEAAGIVGPFAGSKTREVKVANETALEQILRDINNRDNGI